MSDAFLTLYVRTAPGAWILDWVTSTGANLAASAPATNDRVAVLDPEGDRHLVGRDTLRRLLDGDDAGQTFQAWFSNAEDLVVTVRRHGVDDGQAGFVSITCHLNGLTDDDAVAVARAAHRAIGQSAVDGWGLVVDRSGSTADFDWDAFMAVPKASSPIPDLLIRNTTEAPPAPRGSIRANRTAAGGRTTLEWAHRDPGENRAEQLLAALDPERASSLVWYLRDLELVGNGIRGLSVSELEIEVTNSPHGLQISWNELIGLVRDAEDIHDLVATGHDGPTEIVVDAAAGTYPDCVAVVEVFDSGSYRIEWDDSESRSDHKAATRHRR